MAELTPPALLAMRVETAVSKSYFLGHNSHIGHDLTRHYLNIRNIQAILSWPQRSHWHDHIGDPDDAESSTFAACSDVPAGAVVIEAVERLYLKMCALQDVQDMALIIHRTGLPWINPCMHCLL